MNNLLMELLADSDEERRGKNARSGKVPKKRGVEALGILDQILKAGTVGVESAAPDYTLANTIAKKLELEGWKSEARVVVLQRQTCLCCTAQRQFVVFDGIRRVNARLRAYHLVPAVDDSRSLPFEIQEQEIKVPQCAACLELFVLGVPDFGFTFRQKPKQMELWSVS